MQPVADASVAEEPPVEEVPVEEAPSHAVPRGARAGRLSAFKRTAATCLSAGVVGIVGLLTVGMTMPAAAVAAGHTDVPNDVAPLVVTASGVVEVDSDEIQAYVTPAGIEAPAIERPETYDTASIAAVASDLGIQRQSDFYVNDPSAAIQWPFAVGVDITYGFGMRDGRMHLGADFDPGDGAHIQAVADGVVRVATEAGDGYGVQVIIDHIIDGQLISTRYAHMQYGSLQVTPGQQVTVGTFLGRTGNTGNSFGAHTHFEVLTPGDVAIDPIAWLRANAGRRSLS